MIPFLDENSPIPGIGRIFIHGGVVAITIANGYGFSRTDDCDLCCFGDHTSHKVACGTAPDCASGRYYVLADTSTMPQEDQDQIALLKLKGVLS